MCKILQRFSKIVRETEITLTADGMSKHIFALDVPFCAKHEAEMRGCQWDMMRGCWFATGPNVLRCLYWVHMNSTFDEYLSCLLMSYKKWIQYSILKTKTKPLFYDTFPLPTHAVCKGNICQLQLLHHSCDFSRK
jgi:hypothetical protein